MNLNTNRNMNTFWVTFSIFKISCHPFFFELNIGDKNAARNIRRVFRNLRTITPAFRNDIVGAFMLDDIFTQDQQAIMVNYAMKIDTGEIPEKHAIKLLDEAGPILGTQIVLFWMRFNDMTCQVAERLANTRVKMHLEKCYRKKCSFKVIFHEWFNNIRGDYGIRR